MALIAITCTAIGTAVGSVLQDMQGFQLIMNFIVLPLSYGVDGLHGALSGGFAFGAATDFAVLGLLAAILLALGAYLFSKIEV